MNGTTPDRLRAVKRWPRTARREAPIGLGDAGFYVRFLKEQDRFAIWPRSREPIIFSESALELFASGEHDVARVHRPAASRSYRRC